MQMHKAKRVEIIIEAPMESRLTAALEKAGVTEMLHLDRPSAARKAYGLRRTVISKIRNLFRRN